MRLVRADRSEDAYTRFCEKYGFEHGSAESCEAFGLRCAEIDAFNEIDGDEPDEPILDKSILNEPDEPDEPMLDELDELPF